MFILKKVKSATLMETMVATVLIVVLFMMASLIINSLMAAQAKSNKEPIREHLHTVEYSLQSKTYPLPYYEDWRGWQISGEENIIDGIPFIRIEAVNLETEQNVISTIPLYDTH